MQVGELLVGEGEVEALGKLHFQSGIDYKLPQFVHNPRFPIQLSIRHNGDFMGAALVHIDAEVYLFLDHQVATPKERYQALEMLQNVLIQRVREIGLDSMYCVLPPRFERSFGPRLVAHGWAPDRGWPKYTYQICAAQ